jgi:polar amino acid transport system substrate-binding protein
MLDVSFDQQMYDIALLLGSRLRKPIDVAMLETVQSEAWRQILFSYLGGP